MAAVAAVASLHQYVTEMIIGYPELISGDAEKEFESLRDDIESLKAILKDVDDKPSEDHTSRFVHNKIRETVFEIEDTIDSWMAQAAARKGNPRTNCSCFTWLQPNFISLAREVRALRQNIMEQLLANAMVIKDNQGRPAITITEEEKVMYPRIPRIWKETLVVLEDEKAKIICNLMKHQPGLDIISIVGMPGLGKTALAMEIFNDNEIRYEFPILIWVHISQRINTRYVLLQIMKHFTSNSDDLYSMSIEELLSAVHACLSGSKFLMVMDDVWRTEHWDQLKNALPYSNGRGKVLITTCEMAVCRHAQQITEPHSLRFLYFDESWELLQLVVFGKVEICPKELQVIGQDIAKMCEGVPLTISVLGGVLKDWYLSSISDVLVREKWEKVAGNVNLAIEDKKMVMIDVVALSYQSLPDHLKDCFLYLGVFPSGFEIPTWTLTRLWLAEGFIRPGESQSLEEIAEDNLNDLISRNLLMVRKINPMGEVKVCLMHDMIRLFCVVEAAKQNLLLEINMSEEEDEGALQSKLERIHRLCLHSDLDKFFSSNLKLAPRVRSFLCFREDVNSMDPEHSSVIPENFGYLRVLHSKSMEFSGFPVRVINLIHLRYIVLCVSDLMILPESLSQLRSLQTITVDTSSNSLKMKANIWKMIRLRHVKTKAAIVLDDNSWQGQGGKNLQMLSRLSPQSVPEVSRRATNLKTLGVRGNLAPLFQDMPSGNLYHLEKLKLYHAAASENRLQSFPSWDHFVPNLKRLTLSNTFLDWKYMPTFAMIPGLEVLKLKDNAFTGMCWEATSYGFMRLQFLLIDNTNMVLWVALADTFPCLKHLVLKNCENLKEIPDCVLQCLENLEIERVRKSTADSARNSGAQFKLTVGVACDM